MKITVDVDCTPEEARRFIGLPDLTAVHEAYVDQMKKVVAEGISPESLETMIRNWSPMGEAGMSLWRTMFDQMSRAGGAGK